MHLNLNVKIKAGPRTVTEVAVYSTSMNQKTITFANGREIKESVIANWIESELTLALNSIQDKPKVE